MILDSIYYAKILNYFHNYVVGLNFILLPISFAFLLYGASKTPQFSKIIVKKEGLNTSIEGLRGFSAYLVFLSHAVRLYEFQKTGEWKFHFSEHAPISGLGLIGVSLFFITTGYLFWDKIISQKLNIVTYFENRVKRLTPVFLAIASISAVILLILCIRADKNIFNVEFIYNYLSIFAYGFCNNSFGSLDRWAGFIMGASWTLAHEWTFYLLIPLMWVFRKKNALLAHILFLYLYLIILKNNYFILFHLGAIVAEIKNSRYSIQIENSIVKILTPFSLVLLGGAILYAHNYQHNNLWLSTICFLVFLPIAFGGNWYGFLTHRSTQLGGLVSYSMYLGHDLVLFMMIQIFSWIGFPIEEMGIYAFEYWIAFSQIFVVFSSCLLFLYFEKPYIKRFNLNESEEKPSLLKAGIITFKEYRRKKFETAT